MVSDAFPPAYSGAGICASEACWWADGAGVHSEVIAARPNGCESQRYIDGVRATYLRWGTMSAQRSRLQPSILRLPLPRLVHMAVRRQVRHRHFHGVGRSTLPPLLACCAKRIPTVGKLTGWLRMTRRQSTADYGGGDRHSGIVVDPRLSLLRLPKWPRKSRGGHIWQQSIIANIPNGVDTTKYRPAALTKSLLCAAG